MIVNADDYGLTPNVSRGIREAHQRGIVTSTTVLIGMAGAAEAVALAQRETPMLGLGLHLALAGKAVAPVLPPEQLPSLVRPDGRFYDEPEWSARAEHFNPDEIERELYAQFDRFVEVAGQLPTHFDSHYHAVYRQPAALRVLFALADQQHLPVRHPGGIALPDGVRAPAHFISVDHRMSPADLIALITGAAGYPSVELLCHPGYADDQLAALDAMTVEREAELALLTDPAVRQAVEAVGMQWSSFAALPE